MDNPQHYQPLSHALHLPHSATPQQYSSYDSPNGVSINLSAPRPEEEEEEEDDDEDDDGLHDTHDPTHDHHHPHHHPHHQQQHHHHHPPTADSSSKSQSKSPNAASKSTTHKAISIVDLEQAPEPKRRPGRPRGSKNRKPRVLGESTIKPQSTSTFYSFPHSHSHPHSQPHHPPLHSTATATTSAPPTLPETNPQNQQYYEFQWRVLNLCAEFYGAAEELVKSTPPLVLAQCYAMGQSKVDPIIMLTDAKRNCDILLAHPSRLVATPPPPLYHTLPTFVPAALPSNANASPSPAPSGSKAGTQSQAPVITNPQTFVVSLGGQSSQPAPSSSSSSSNMPYPNMYNAPTAPAQYPTTPYYQFSPFPYYPPNTTTQQSSSTPTATGQATTTTAAGSGSVGQGTNSNIAVNQGAWSDTETERLKKLAEESRMMGAGADIEWDWVVNQWGNGRSRHQILIKATSLGLKSSTSRGIKRRRDTDVAGESPTDPSSLSAHAPQQQHTPQMRNNSIVAEANSSTAPSASPATSTPHASPALSHLPHPHQPRPTSSSSATAAKPHLPWPMPTVAANTPSPVIAAATPDSQRPFFRAPPPPPPRPGPPGDPVGVGVGVVGSSQRPSSRAGTFVFHNGGGRKGGA